MRLVQVVLVLLAAGLLAFAGYTLGRVDGYESGRRAGDIDAPRSPSAVQVAVMTVLGLASLGAALLLQGPNGVRVPTPARLDELAGRAESAALERAAALSPEQADEAKDAGAPS